MKLYVVLLEWCENSDDEQEIVLVTTNLELAKEKLRELALAELDKHLTFTDNDGFTKPWVVMDHNKTKFYHHGYFPDFCRIRILEFIDPKPITPDL